MKSMWAIIVNLKAGKKTSGDYWKQIESNLQAKKVKFDAFFTQKVGDARQFAISCLEKGYRRLAILGGDGTFSELVDGIMKSGVDPKTVQVALFPGGTGNDWARYWKIKQDPQQLAQILLDDHAELVDVGCLSFENEGQIRNRYFINAYGFGFDGRVIQLTNEVQHTFKGHSWTYTAALFLAVLKHRPQEMRIDFEDQTLEGMIYTSSSGNGRFTGGGLAQTPDAVPTDGFLDVMVTEKLNLIDVFTALRLLFKKQLTQHPKVHLIRSKHFKVRSLEPVVSEIDGLLQPEISQFEVSLIPQAIQFVHL